MLPDNNALCRLLLGALALAAAVPATAQITDVPSLVRAVENGSAGDTVTIGPGTFELTAPLEPKPRMTIRGAGTGQTVLAAQETWRPSTDGLPKSDDPSAYLFDLSETNGVTISDMTLTGPSLHGAIYGEQSRGVALSNLKIERFRWSGIRTRNVSELRVHDCEFVDAGGRFGNTTGGALYMHWPVESEFWNNRITRSSEDVRVYGFKGYGGRKCRFHHNTVEVNFSLEFPHDDNEHMEVDHNAFVGTISIPRRHGGAMVSEGYTFHIHHNWLRKSYALEWPRNDVEVAHNLFEFDAMDDTGNLVSRFGDDMAPGPTLFHDNLIRNPGRGIFWSQGIYNNFRFYNNHVRAETPSRQEGLFGFDPESDFDTIAILDNIIECSEANPRPLMRNDTSYGASISNNTLVNISDTDSYLNPDTGDVRGPREPLRFRCGVQGEFLVDGWSAAPAGSSQPGDLQQ